MSLIKRSEYGEIYTVPRREVQEFRVKIINRSAYSRLIKKGYGFGMELIVCAVTLANDYRIINRNGCVSQVF